MYGANKTKLICPQCGQNTKVMVMPRLTKLERFPLWCNRCKYESIIDYDMSQNRKRSEPTV